MSIYVGNTKIGQMYLGSTEIAEAYLGSTKVYQNSLPYDARIEYLQSDGNQYIDTGFVPKNTSCAVIAFEDYTANGRWCFGARQGYLNKCFGLYSANDAKTPEVQFGGSSVNISTDYSLQNKGIITLNMDGVSKTATLSSELGATISKSLPAGTFTSPCTLALFGLNNNGSVISMSAIKCHSFKVYDNSTLVRDFIPVRVGQVGYMYDQVSGQLFGNAGSGSFVLGNDV